VYDSAVIDLEVVSFGAAGMPVGKNADLIGDVLTRRSYCHG
jgi:hypothetical protein